MVSYASSSGGPRRQRGRQIQDRSRLAVLDVFRISFAEKDGQASNTHEVDKKRRSTTNQVSNRSNARRLGVDEDTLRAHVHDHLATLMNSIRLDATVSLEDTPNVAKSVLNYGFQDLSNLSRSELNSYDIRESIRQSLADHEPRLVKDTIKVSIQTLEGDSNQRITVNVSAELIADPADIPVEFQADVDMGAGKVTLSSTRI